MESDSGHQELPAWLTAHAAYDPPSDRDRFLRRNILSLASVLRSLRQDPAHVYDSAWDRTCARVMPGLRLLGLVVLVAAVSLARNMAYVWFMLVALLALTASRDARAIRGVLLPAFVAAGVAALVNLPAALLLGQTATPVRMAAKTFVTVGFAAMLAQGLGAEGIVRALQDLRLPTVVVTAVDLALRDLVVLGESALSLSEALALRSVGRDTQKTSSAAGVMGTTFIRAHLLATVRAEAMELRGYSGELRRGERRRLCGADVVYGLGVALCVALCVYLEVALP